MKLHDLRPAKGAHTPRTRVGRGIAAGKGKTAGRGTKGQKSRAGSSIPPWFEGGQTPLHMRIPKLRGFKRPFKIEYEIVNVGAIGALAERGAFEGGEPAGGSRSKKAAPVTVNQDVLRAVGLVRTLKRPLKVLGAGELSTPLFVVADAFTKSAVAKIEAAGGTVSVLELPTRKRRAIGVDGEPSTTAEATEAAEATAAVTDAPDDAEATEAEASEADATSDDAAPEAAPKPRTRRSRSKAAASDEETTAESAETGSGEASDAPEHA
jgi:large subunit ribosomal protein L15